MHSVSFAQRYWECVGNQLPNQVHSLQLIWKDHRAAKSPPPPSFVLVIYMQFNFPPKCCGVGQLVRAQLLWERHRLPFVSCENKSNNNKAEHMSESSDWRKTWIQPGSCSHWPRGAASSWRRQLIGRFAPRLNLAKVHKQLRGRKLNRFNEQMLASSAPLACFYLFIYFLLKVELEQFMSGAGIRKKKKKTRTSYIKQLKFWPQKESSLVYMSVNTRGAPVIGNLKEIDV